MWTKNKRHFEKKRFCVFLVTFSSGYSFSPFCFLLFVVCCSCMRVVVLLLLLLFLLRLDTKMLTTFHMLENEVGHCFCFDHLLFLFVLFCSLYCFFFLFFCVYVFVNSKQKTQKKKKKKTHTMIIKSRLFNKYITKRPDQAAVISA